QVSKSGWSAKQRDPDTTPVPNKTQTALPSMALEALPHDPDVSMAKWLDKHVTDAAAPQTKEAAKVDDSKAPQKAKLVMCPVLGSLIAEGSLKKDDQGNVSLKQLNDAMVNRLGITPERAAVTVGTGTIGNHFTDLGQVLGGKLNIDHLGGSF